MKLCTVLGVVCLVLFVVSETNGFIVNPAASTGKEAEQHPILALISRVLSIFSPPKASSAAAKKNASSTTPKPAEASPTASGGQAAKSSSFEQKSLESHNKYRAKHGVPPLTIDPTLTKFALAWAKKLAKESRMYHAPNNKYGENLYMGWSSDPNFALKGGEASDSWYSEIKDYNYALGSKNDIKKIGHFTQMVWKDTKKIGVAKAKSKDGKWFVVAEYSPPGNVIGTFKTKVPKPVK